MSAPSMPQAIRLISEGPLEAVDETITPSTLWRRASSAASCGRPSTGASPSKCLRSASGTQTPATRKPDAGERVSESRLGTTCRASPTRTTEDRIATLATLAQKPPAPQPPTGDEGDQPQRERQREEPAGDLGPQQVGADRHDAEDAEHRRRDPLVLLGPEPEHRRAAGLHDVHHQHPAEEQTDGERRVGRLRDQIRRRGSVDRGGRGPETEAQCREERGGDDQGVRDEQPAAVGAGPAGTPRAGVDRVIGGGADHLFECVVAFDCGQAPALRPLLRMKESPSDSDQPEG